MYSYYRRNVRYKSRQHSAQNNVKTLDISKLLIRNRPTIEQMTKQVVEIARNVSLRNDNETARAHFTNTTGHDEKNRFLLHGLKNSNNNNSTNTCLTDFHFEIL